MEAKTKQLLKSAYIQMKAARETLVDCGQGDLCDECTQGGNQALRHLTTALECLACELEPGRNPIIHHIPTRKVKRSR